MNLIEYCKNHKHVTVFILTVISDFWSNWYGYAVNHNWIFVQAFVGIALPFLNFPFFYFFIEENSVRERLKLTATSAIAMTVGSTLMLLMLNHGVGVGKKFF